MYWPICYERFSTKFHYHVMFTQQFLIKLIMLWLESLTQPKEVISHMRHLMRLKRSHYDVPTKGAEAWTRTNVKLTLQTFSIYFHAWERYSNFHCFIQYIIDWPFHRLEWKVVMWSWSDNALQPQRLFVLHFICYTILSFIESFIIILTSASSFVKTENQCFYYWSWSVKGNFISLQCQKVLKKNSVFMGTEWQVLKYSVIPMITGKYFCSALSVVKKVLINWMLGTLTSLDALEDSLSTEHQAVEGKWDLVQRCAV